MKEGNNMEENEEKKEYEILKKLNEKLINFNSIDKKKKNENEKEER